MIAPCTVFNSLKSAGVNFFVGVPDSLLKDFCAYVTNNSNSFSHQIAPNEGCAIGMAIGNYLATNAPSLVYLQNSGIGNAVNPLLSLADKEVYSIPMVLMVGWRGEPNVKDEPQHVKQGRVMEQLLNALEIEYRVLTKDESDVESLISSLVKSAMNSQSPVVLLVSKGAFESYSLSGAAEPNFEMSREEAIREIVNLVPEEAFVVSTTGMTSRELFEIRQRTNKSHDRDFLTVGGMGHASSIALGLSYAKRTERIICIDGDGAVLMHMGALSSVGTSSQENFIHIVINNAAHDSVGGQPTLAMQVSLLDIAKACGYPAVYSVDSSSALQSAIQEAIVSDGPIFIEVRVRKGARKDLGRPTSTPIQNRDAMMKVLK